MPKKEEKPLVLSVIEKALYSSLFALVNFFIFDLSSFFIVSKELRNSVMFWSFVKWD